MNLGKFVICLIILFYGTKVFGLDVVIFGRNWTAPGECYLHASSPSNQITSSNLQCDVGDKGTIFIFLHSNCPKQDELRFELTVEEDIAERGFYYLQLTSKLRNSTNFLYLRQIYNEDHCIGFQSYSRKGLAEISKGIWHSNPIPY